MRGEGYSLLSRTYPSIFRVLLAAVMLAAASFIAGPSQTAVLADGPNRAGLVVQFGDGSVWTACISFPEQELTSLELLRRSGLAVLIEEWPGYGGAVCKIQGDGCDFPMAHCFCQCEGAECTYWAYYHLGPDGNWQYANVGSSTYWVSHGAVEGWAWGPGDYGLTGARPPAVTFKQVCPPATTATHTPMALAMSQPDALPPSPTFTPLPPTETPAATVVAFLPPAPTPKVWARAEAPDNMRTHLPAAATPEPYAAPAGDVGQDPPPRLLFDYSLFFLCAALMAALTTWAARRHMR